MKPATEKLVKELKSSDTNKRLKAAEALGESKDPAAVSALVAALHDPDSTVRLGVTVALGRLGDRRATEPLATILKDPTFFLRGAAALSLALLGDPKATGALERALRDEANPGIQKQIQTAISRLREVEGKEVALIQESRREAQGPLPSLSILGMVAEKGLRINEWDFIKLLVENSGEEAARDIEVEVNAPMEVSAKKVPPQLVPKERGEVVMGVKPTATGRNVPVEFKVSYRDARGNKLVISDLQFLPVSAPNESKSPVTPTIIVSGDYVGQGGTKAGGDVFAPKIGRGSVDAPSQPHPRDFCPSENEPIHTGNLPTEKGSAFCPFCGTPLS